MNVLFIEDYTLKEAQVIRHLKEVFPMIRVKTENSYISGLREVIRNHEEYQLLLLDISMPNYDISSEENGGEWLPLAGKNILKQLYLRDISIKVIVITMHGSFDDGVYIADLDAELKGEFPENYIGYVYYSQTNEDWKESLTKLIKVTI